MEAWIDHPNVTAVLFAHYPGQEAGDAIADVLYGDVSPSGKMPFTTAKKESDYVPNTIVADPVKAPQAYFNESTVRGVRPLLRTED
jgi:beta-glucosidase